MGLLGATALCFICMLKLVYYFEAEIEKKKWKWKGSILLLSTPRNRPFLGFPKPLFESEAMCEAIDMEMIFKSHAKQLIFTRKVVYLASFWKWEFLELRNPNCANSSVLQ